MTSFDFRFTAIQTMPVMTGPAHNLVPTEQAGFLRIDPGASDRDITGIVSVPNGRVIVLHNAGTRRLTLRHESALSMAQNRMALPDGSNVVVRPNGSAYLVYDGIVARWKLLAAV